ncbi:16S rRNA (cytosine(1402)-N(4))-methyltransferase RsmH [Limosilactobacillus portuensis]|jgi:16S rRNA (cytosine1402-N4)-methyltransferase|uniref:Ribosomal RNA small subunit methyltransferase H n=1 Tax=Limosilactobacillus portuensis TaxID=2742601 RepID=A0ABS6IY83_9LACO|nr:16S rRNA (cytosine(1402)-N(4))-methyltransferase RsmH [Limosilactobacillus portuensis]MBU9695142.1 16S rRNA (cytosine(1402)-N(4))-methyltransferase RsmH [Limosilactobacillus portuensis]MDU1505352.1 16S rRNA (cytosine(1402)-N(4))-methyltransferase RsmH [Limosilactobacillus vaginalis]PMC27264.1 16S rRNA (cytosine(1402)-N(4))-methyltransferase [Gardnerella vaginalis]WCT60089.1 16S rRNA (cytosine(1402)-N(4))-methyltransferase RsmH [Limosilactobacillus portuensis]
MTEFKHVTVLLNEAVAGLNVHPDGTYVDATLGGGGHSSAILNQLTTGRLYSFDQDQTAIKYNQQHLKKFINDGRSILIEDNFRNLETALSKNGVKSVDGVVYDLGVSSPQFDDAQRGFSYKLDAPLDMRMNQQQALSAMNVVNEWPYEKLVKILYRYGEERFAKQIARKIERRRESKPIKTTFELVNVIKEAIPAAARRHGGHPAKKTFQAIRIAVNDELGALEDSLEQALELLNVGGRISVITFQSLEDRLVKTMFHEQVSLADELPPGLPVIPPEMQPKFKLINKKPILPSQEELADNHRAHSAKLRIIERIKK